MPFKSDAQRKFMYAKHPDIAKRWTEKYPISGKLPDKVLARREALKKRAGK